VLYLFWLVLHVASRSGIQAEIQPETTQIGEVTGKRLNFPDHQR
jgi:hypothetical protein